MADSLDPQVVQELLRILKKGLADENSLTDGEKAYLRARQSYVAKKHQDLLPSVFSKKAAKEGQKKEEQLKTEKEEKAKKDAEVFDGQPDPYAPEEVTLEEQGEEVELDEDLDEEDLEDEDQPQG